MPSCQGEEGWELLVQSKAGWVASGLSQHPPLRRPWDQALLGTEEKSAVPLGPLPTMNPCVCRQQIPSGSEVCLSPRSVALLLTRKTTSKFTKFATAVVLSVQMMPVPMSDCSRMPTAPSYFPLEEGGPPSVRNSASMHLILVCAAPCRLYAEGWAD